MMWNRIFHFFDKLIPVTEPLQSVLISLVLTIITCISVILIGAGVEKLEQLEIKGLKILFKSKTAVFIINRLTFPGTILHECAHAAFAWATGAKVEKIKLLTFFDAHCLGYVYFSPRGNKLQQRFQLAISSCAPVFVGLTTLSIIIKLWIYFNPSSGWKCLLVYSFISVFNHMSMSEPDIKNYCKGLVGVFPILFLLFYAIRFYCYR